MKYLLYSLILACSACHQDQAAPEAVTTVEPVPVPGTDTPDQMGPEPPTRPNFSSTVYGFVIVHGPNADSVSGQINRRLNQGYFLRGSLRTERVGAAGFEYVQAMSKEVH